MRSSMNPSTLPMAPPLGIGMSTAIFRPDAIAMSALTRLG